MCLRVHLFEPAVLFHAMELAPSYFADDKGSKSLARRQEKAKIGAF
jgi:hypothetical protein